MGYLIAAYAVLWLISLGLVASMSLRLSKVQALLRELQQLVGDEGKRSQ